MHVGGTLHLGGDLLEGLDGLGWVGAYGGLPGEEKNVHAVQDRRGDVADFGPGRCGKGHHRFQELSGENNALAHAVGPLENPLLEQEELFRPCLNPQIPPGDDDSVGHRENGLQVFHGQRLLDLGEDRRLGTQRGEFTPEQENILGALDEGEGDLIDPVLGPEPKVFPVLLGDRGKRGDHRVGEVDAFVGKEGSADDDPCPHPASLPPGHLQLDLTVVEKEPVSALGVDGKVGEVRGNLNRARGNLAFRVTEDDHILLPRQLEGGGKEADPQLGTPQVLHDGKGNVEFLGESADRLDEGPGIAVGEMGEVEADTVHPGLQERA
ncbi:MAG: hypothetical protein BWY86_01292 [Candidatus Aminicenantes bacterium ADurb.Bin508]|nr:MAG: hypothetical protein BWY86_01292 [Candidatus Aminicenantes bacterium ADurb.Bin508]